MSATSQPTQERRGAAAASHPGRNQPVVRNRLPSLAEVLRRSTWPGLRHRLHTLISNHTDTRPPVDLYCYYLFLQREGSEDTLDFWLDVQQHENLCQFSLKGHEITASTVD